MKIVKGLYYDGGKGFLSMDRSLLDEGLCKNELFEVI